MRILILIHNIAERSGSSSRATGLARGLAALGHQVDVVCASRKAGFRPVLRVLDGIRLIESPDLAPARVRHAGFGAWDLAHRMRWVSSERYDLVHAFEHRPTSLLPALWLRKTTDIPLISDWADIWGEGGIIGARSMLSRWTVGTYDRAVEARAHAAASAMTVVSTRM